MDINMTTESSDEEAEGQLVGISKHLIVDSDLIERTNNVTWSASSSKPGNGIQCILDDNLETYWQSHGVEPHSINIRFQKKVKLQLIVLYVNYELDKTYTPSMISVKAGDGHNLKEIKAVELVKPTGWVYISLSGDDPWEFFVNTFMLQIAVLSEGNDTRLRQIKIYGPRPNPIPCQPFHFSSAEFIRYSIVR
ncbi:anaphase-promoting complex subunit 10-like isoform X2 [Silene latifolia]